MDKQDFDRKQFLETWASALELPENQQRQIRGRLRNSSGSHVCALGLAQQLSPYGLFYVKTYRTGTDNNLSKEIINLNDNLKMSFWDIAQFIRANYLKEEQ